MCRTTSSTSSGERERERLEIADDLVDVFDDAGNRLVLVNDAVDAERPDRRAAERRQQHAPHRVAERVAEAALERLEPEFGDIGVVFALGRFDQLRADESAEIDRVCHVVMILGLAGVRRHRPTPPFTRGRLEWE